MAKDFFQVYSINFTKMLTTTIKHKLLKISLTIARMLEIILLQINSIDTYLESVLDQKNWLIYIKMF